MERYTPPSQTGRQADEYEAGLMASGYAPEAAVRVRHLEAIEERLLDLLDERALTAAETRQLALAQAELAELAAAAKARRAIETFVVTGYQLDSADPGRPPRPQPRRLPTLPPAPGRREALRRLLHVRGTQLEQTTGEDWTEKRHELIVGLLGYDCSSSELDADALSVLVDHLTEDLEAAGFDLAAADAAYQARQLERAWDAVSTPAGGGPL